MYLINYWRACINPWTSVVCALDRFFFSASSCEESLWLNRWSPDGQRSLFPFKKESMRSSESRQESWVVLQPCSENKAPLPLTSRRQAPLLLLQSKPVFFFFFWNHIRGGTCLTQLKQTELLYPKHLAFLLTVLVCTWDPHHFFYVQ